MEEILKDNENMSLIGMLILSNIFFIRFYFKQIMKILSDTVVKTNNLQERIIVIETTLDIKNEQTK